ncbi:MAG: hypothetical protein OET18_04465 [Desulfobacterales bacterium]|nr:hypothetical protein [Desulfobacterales bacterium]
MSILNKNNYGYISPSDFNLYARQAQLDIFETYFYSYNYQLQKENARQSGTGYADITKGLEEVIDTFSVTLPLLNSGGNNYFLPSLITTSNDYYLINKNLVYNNELAEGTTTATNGGGVLVQDVTADFISAGVQVGDIVSTVTNGITYNTIVVNIISSTDLLVSTTPSEIVWNAIGKTYNIYSVNDVKEAEKVTHSKITMLNNSLLTRPNLTYPVYIQNGLTVQIHPNTVDGVGQLVSQYIRFPYPPNWTYVSLTNGEPAFDETAVDYQDFELPNDDEVNLVMKILQYAGMSIREIAAVQFAGSEEAQSEQQEK